MIALVGRNGCGKSTLLRSIAGLQQAISGSIRLYDREIGRYKSLEFASLLSFVGTNRTVFENMTVYELVSLGRHPYTNWWGGLKKKDREKVLESISFVGMEAFTDSKVEKLSDGERQRVMIASALAQDTNVILLDEPTAFLDIPNRMGIAEVLHKLKMAGKAVIFSTHDFDSAFNYADKLWIIHSESLIEGAPEDLGLNNIFVKIFADSNIRFDAEDLRFKRKNHATKSVYIEKSSAANFQWTCRALERIGFEVITNKKDSVNHIHIAEEASGISWHLSRKNYTNTFHSIYDLAAYLTKDH